MVCALILWRSCFGLLTDKFRQFLTVLVSAKTTSEVSFPDANFSKYQWISTKLAMCIGTIEVCFWNANDQIQSEKNISEIYSLYCELSRLTHGVGGQIAKYLFTTATPE